MCHRKESEEVKKIHAAMASSAVAAEDIKVFVDGKEVVDVEVQNESEHNNLRASSTKPHHAVASHGPQPANCVGENIVCNDDPHSDDPWCSDCCNGWHWYEGQQWCDTTAASCVNAGESSFEYHGSLPWCEDAGDQYDYCCNNAYYQSGDKYYCETLRK